MKSYFTHNNLPLIALLFLGLACSPLIANADDGNRGRHGYSQHDHGKHHNGNGHRKDYRNRGHGHHDNRKSYWRGYKRGYKNGYYDDRPYGHRARYCNVHRRYYGHEHHHDPDDFLFGLYTGNLGIIFRD